MKKISFNEGTLGFDNNIVTYEIPLERTNISSIEEIQFIRDIPFMFPVTNLELTQNKTFFLMEFEVEDGFRTLGYFKSNSTEEEKYDFIEKLCEIGNELKNYGKLVTVLDDKNILVNPEKREVKLLYRGVKGLMPSASYNEEDIETQVKRLALFILTGAKYDEIRVNGLEAALSKSSQERYKLVSKIAQAKSLDHILILLEGLKDEKDEREHIVEKPTKSIFSKIPVIRKDIEEKVSKINKPKKEKTVKPIIEKRPPKEKKKIKERISASQATFEEDNKSFFADKSKLKVITGTMVGLVLIIIVITLFSKGDPAKTTLANSEKDEDILIEGLQYAAIQNYEDASQNFGKMKTSFDELSEDAQRAILFSYLMAGKYQEAIDAEPKFSYSVINYLVSKENLDVVKNIDSDEPVIKFEKASINKDFNTVIKLKDDVKLDGRRESLVVDAYIGLNKFDEAMEFAESKGNKDLMTKIENIISAKVKKEQEEKKAKEKNEKTDTKDKKETKEDVDVNKA
ncbi:hypothetical protein ACFWMS_23600 [Peribacillus butanolivorans]|uniref:hypothetical protein n=1 Tax=Peribacillus butanolivorans TaxID=421767 RepID=UPI003669616E